MKRRGYVVGGRPGWVALLKKAGSAWFVLNAREQKAVLVVLLLLLLGIGTKLWHMRVGRRAATESGTTAVSATGNARRSGGGDE